MHACTYAVVVQALATHGAGSSSVAEAGLLAVRNMAAKYFGNQGSLIAASASSGE